MSMISGNTGLMLFILGGIFGITGLIVLIMAIRNISRGKRTDYSGNNGMNMQNQMPQNSDYMPTQTPQNSRPMNRGVDFDPFSENNDRMGNMPQQAKSPNMGQNNRVRSVEFDPFNDNMGSSMQGSDSFDPFSESSNSPNNIDLFNDMGRPSRVPKSPNRPMSTPKMPKINSNPTPSAPVFDDFDPGMGYDEPRVKNIDFDLDLDEDLEEF